MYCKLSLYAISVLLFYSFHTVYLSFSCLYIAIRIDSVMSSFGQISVVYHLYSLGWEYLNRFRKKSSFPDYFLFFKFLILLQYVGFTLYRFLTSRFIYYISLSVCLRISVYYMYFAYRHETMKGAFSQRSIH